MKIEPPPPATTSVLKQPLFDDVCQKEHLTLTPNDHLHLIAEALQGTSCKTRVLTLQGFTEEDIDSLPLIAKALATSPTIEYLYIYHCTNSHTPTLLAQALETNTTLISITMSRCPNVGDDGIALIASALKMNPQSSISSVDFSNIGMGDEGVKALMQDTNVCELSLGNDDNIGLEGIKAIAKAIARPTSCMRKMCLRQIHLSNTAMKHVSRALRKSHLEHLHLESANTLTSSGIIAMAHSLKVNTSLKWVRIASVDFTSGGQALCQALQWNVSLHRLYLDGAFVRTVLIL
mmetsp:Transcript_31151/g.47715  ORF Transcript_31151/g.47715 Transcript_31151/m.47715 type:complete len:291 (-) Transcript_31151:48-920(-)|eukprot:CAMPEP_0118677372 /NCGR_PEP_ID=MMETSP0800-20121206/2591_1 /TAXON_ID=210618 ORGANISM="Striatella unipunctata, Strain CCMP2910" /NCGR_SAMPLE_ID=MMETSP0800 /ASSEMBLY_ACC=CAM_ASM_000638 /LENGTH=290 /DNA_ID=CAMNT_0006573039 /DNA_START=642 /DNA_END=1514 /DNA_ORIENTATION=+